MISCSLWDRIMGVLGRVFLVLGADLQAPRWGLFWLLEAQNWGLRWIETGPIKPPTRQELRVCIKQIIVYHSSQDDKHN